MAPGLAGDLGGTYPRAFREILRSYLSCSETEIKRFPRLDFRDGGEVGGEDGLFNRNSNAGPMLSMGCRSSCMIAA
jgi:hypothetical protein